MFKFYTCPIISCFYIIILFTKVTAFYMILFTQYSQLIFYIPVESFVQRVNSVYKLFVVIIIITVTECCFILFEH